MDQSQISNNGGSSYPINHSNVKIICRI